MKKQTITNIIAAVLCLAVFGLCQAAEKDGFVLNVKSGGEYAKEINGTVNVVFNSEYELLLKNNTDKRCSARVFIDGARVSPGGDFVINSHDSLLLERFVTDLNTGKRFKFVPLSDPAVDDPTRKENGVIRVEFRKEDVPDRVLKYPPKLENWKDCDTWKYDGSEWNCWDMVWYLDGTVSLTNTNVAFTDADNVDMVLSTHDGATVAGNDSTQRFYKVDYDFEESFVEIVLKMKGVPK